MLILLLLAFAVNPHSDWTARLDQGIDAIHAEDYSKAVRVLSKVVNEAKTNPRGDIRTADSMLALATAWRYQGEFGKAEPLLLKARDAYAAGGSAASSRLALTFDNLGQIRLGQGRYGEAEQFLQSARGLYESTLGPSDVHALNVRRFLGEVYLATGRLRDAGSLFDRLMAASRNSPKLPGLTLAAVLRGQATVNVADGKYSSAEPLLRESLQLTRALGESRPAYADSMVALSQLYRLEGRTARAMPLAMRAAHIYASAQDPAIVSAWSELGMDAIADQKYAIAKDYLSRAADTQRHRFGPDHVEVAFLESELAEAYLGDENPAEARRLIQHALSVDEHVFGSSYYGVARMLVIAARVEESRADTSAADSDYRQAISIYRRTLPADHPDLVQARQSYHRFEKRAEN